MRKGFKHSLRVHTAAHFVADFSSNTFPSQYRRSQVRCSSFSCVDNEDEDEDNEGGDEDDEQDEQLEDEDEETGGGGEDDEEDDGEDNVSLAYMSLTSATATGVHGLS